MNTWAINYIDMRKIKTISEIIRLSNARKNIHKL